MFRHQILDQLHPILVRIQIQTRIQISHSEIRVTFDVRDAINQLKSKQTIAVIEFDHRMKHFFFVPFDRLTVKKDGPNKGREFYKCPKQPPCNFFEWADASAQNTSGGAPRASTSGSNYQNQPRNFGNDTNDQGQGKLFFFSIVFNWIFL